MKQSTSYDSSDANNIHPAAYPAKCSISPEELAVLRDAFHDEVTDSHSESASRNDSSEKNREDHGFGEKLGEWPPTDGLGNVYPIWFTFEDLDDNGNLRDSNGSPYTPFQGNLEPRARTKDDLGYCNAPLNNWRDRYPQLRFCGQITKRCEDGGTYTYCPTHKGRANIADTAEEVMEAGLYGRSVDHLYEKLGPWKKLVGWASFESLMRESSYDFGVEYRKRRFDFSEEPFVPEDVDADGVLAVKYGYPTEHLDPALSLYVAAMQTVQMMTLQPRIMWEGTREDGTEEGMMETKTVEAAQLTAPNKADPTQEFETIETWDEHHLNLPLSRLIKDHPKLLEMGGVAVGLDGASDDVDGDHVVLEIEADPDGVETAEDTGTDPNALGDDYESESERIVDSVTSSSSDGD